MKQQVRGFKNLGVFVYNSISYSLITTSGTFLTIPEGPRIQVFLLVTYQQLPLPGSTL
jgi:hypothetical protein